MDPPYETFQRRGVSRRWAKIRLAGTSGRIAPPGFIDANTVMTKPTDVIFGWLMAFWTDWFVCDSIHDGQNVSLHQSIKASNATAHFYYEEEGNLTSHLQCGMRVIRNRGPNIKETLRSCPRRCGIGRKPKGRGDNKKWVGCDSRTATNEDTLDEYLHSVFQISPTRTPVCTLSLSHTLLLKSEVSAAVSITAVYAASKGQSGVILGFKSFSKGT